MPSLGGTLWCGMGLLVWRTLSPPPFSLKINKLSRDEGNVAARGTTAISPKPMTTPRSRQAGRMVGSSASESPGGGRHRAPFLDHHIGLPGPLADVGLSAPGHMLGRRDTSLHLGPIKLAHPVRLRALTTHTTASTIFDVTRSLKTG